MMWQTMNLLCDKALAEHGGSLPRPVTFLFDEFANIGKIPDIESMAAVVRSRNMSISVVLQSIAQLKANYSEETAQTIVDCCDTTLFLGGKSNETNREISEMLNISMPYTKKLVGIVKEKLGLEKRGDIRKYLLDGGMGVYEMPGKILAVCMSRTGVECDTLQRQGIMENLSQMPFGQAEDNMYIAASTCEWNIPFICTMITMS